MCVVHVMTVPSVLQWREGGTERVCVCVGHVMSVLSVLQWHGGGTDRVCVLCM